MTQLFGLFICGAMVIGLVYLDREPGVTPSRALWIPVIWLLINGSRGVSTWIHTEPILPLSDKYSEGSPLDAAIFGLLIVAGLLVLNLRAREVKSFLHENLPLLVFFGYCALSIAWSEYPFVALKRWSKSIGDIVMVMLLVTDPYPLIAIKRVLARVTFILLPCSVLFIWFIPAIGTGYSPEDNVMMYFGVTTFKNLLGMICMVLGISSWWSFYGAFQNRAMQNRTRHMIAHASMVLMAIVLILRADSMTSFSCLFLAGTVLTVVSQKWVASRPGRAMLVVSGAIGLPLFALFINTMGSLVQSLGRNSTLTGRTSIWKAVLSMHTNPIIGTGFESFWLGNRLQAVWNMSVKGIQEAHNGFIELYLNLGWIGLFILGWLIVSGFRNGVTALRRDPNDGSLRLALLTASLIFSLTEAGFHMLSPIWFAFLLAIAGNSAGLGPRVSRAPVAANKGRVASTRQIRVLQ